MNLFTVKKFGRALLLLAAVAVSAVCWVGCGGGDDDTFGGNVTAGGNDTVGNNTGGNNTISGGSNCTSGGECRSAIMRDGRRWMTENLNIVTEGSWCYGDTGYDEMQGRYLTDAEVEANCAKYGRLYTWSAARAACPRGWKLPSREEWDTLVMRVGNYPDIGYYDAGMKLKAGKGWYNNGNGTDTTFADTLFWALPGGYRYSDGRFGYAGYYGVWWTATAYGGERAYSRNMYYNNNNVNEDYRGKTDGFSVRCVEDI